MALQFNPPPFQQRPNYEREAFYGMNKNIGDIGDIMLQLSELKRLREQQALENAQKQKIYEETYGKQVYPPMGQMINTAFPTRPQSGIQIDTNESPIVSRYKAIQNLQPKFDYTKVGLPQETGEEYLKFQRGFVPGMETLKKIETVKKLTGLGNEEELTPYQKEMLNLSRERMGSLETERGTRIDERTKGRYRNYLLDMEQRDPIIKQVRSQDISLGAIDKLAPLVKGGNTVAFSSLAVKMARGMGEVGVLTETDLTRYVQSRMITQGVADKLSNWLQGRPSNATVDEIGQITSTLRQAFQEKIQPEYDKYIKSYASIEGIEPSDLASKMGLTYSGNKQSKNNEPFPGVNPPNQGTPQYRWNPVTKKLEKL